MLKFIRLYGKWLLPIFVCFLAVAMLLTGYQSWQKDSDRSSAVVAHLADGRALTMGDRQTAKSELDLLGACVQDPLLLRGQGGGREEASADRWMLLQAEADRMGVTVGDAEIHTALYFMGFIKADAEGKPTGGLDESAIAAFCGAHQTTLEGLRHAVRGYLRAATVTQLLTGSAHDLAPGSTSSTATTGLQRLIQIRRMGMALETQRLSESLLAHQLQDLGASVTGKLVVLPGATPGRVAAEAEPTEAQLKELFEQGKDKARGEAPHGFGYRLPPRVKAEAVRIPVAEGLRAAASQVTEDDVRDFFEKNPQEFQPKDADGKPKAGEAPVLTLENRKKAREMLLAAKGRELTLAFARTAAAALAGDARLAAANNNQLPAGATPTPLSAAAEAVRAKHGFAPELLDAAKIQAETAEAVAKTMESKDGLPPLPTPGAAEGWVVPQNLMAHPTLGLARLDEHARIMPHMVALALAAGSGKQDSLPGLAPALNLPLPVVVAADGTCSILRFTAAEAPRAAASLDEVKAQVSRDARILSAWRNLAAHQDALVQNAAKDDLEKFASATDKLFAVPSLARTDPASPGRLPAIPGVGRNEALLKAVFDRAEALRARPGGVKSADAKDRLVAFSDERLCAVVLFQIDDYAPLPRSEQLAQSKESWQRFAVHHASGGTTEDPTAEAALKKRLGWSEK